MDSPIDPAVAPQPTLISRPTPGGMVLLSSDATEANCRGDPKKPTRYMICCDRDAIRKAQGFGNRKTGTSKNDCP
ncbi:predicted protein [Chaetomium globosum CBS 148.51]|uniref:Uncharacterized protein n=1 Tax=Chaetomium globosum (strain ATCC 6205 / CBS 148.51 / DSM 1962 / NBRC 6347 / NRRL 1970) TaxID=306901 RepID=Q2GYJ6_CHAGB|nr:uncharacterized protein CHGG_06958 [Chaetomium globosum CBS 148.51]EAQ85705.1 predicted protein [Chaetomium globosum CBS 148.51]